MVNWTDHGSPLSYKSFSWAGGSAWAGQCVHRNGKFYWYVPVAQKNGGMAVGVAVSNSPTGPFADALGKPLASTGTGDIDPSVFIDDDGQAYLYWGNPNLWYVRLNEDMVSYTGTPTKVALTSAGFGTRSNSDRPTAYEEGPWFYKRGSLYYIVYPGDGVPENISYTTSSSPTGPWTFRGIIMDKQMGAGTSFTNHPGVVDFAGNSYFFYHNGALPGGGGYKRSVCVEKFSYGADGSFPKITMSTSGPAAVATLNPYLQTEAETMASESGVETEVCSEGGLNLTSIQSGDSIQLKSVDFGTGALAFTMRVAAAASGGSIELRLDSAAGLMVGTCAVQSTGGAQAWATQSCNVNGASGKHDLLLRFSGPGGELFKLNWWKFMPRDPLPDAGVADASAPASDAGLTPAMGDAASGMRGIDSGQPSGAGGGGAEPPSQRPIVEAGASDAGGAGGASGPDAFGGSAQDSSDGGGCQMASTRSRNCAIAGPLICLALFLRRRFAGGGRLARL
jgi:hypothetical protein